MIDTRDKILLTAEQLFAEQGYAATSLRQIIGKAGVNLAAVHYHFGSKEELLDELVHRKAEPVNQERLLRLDRGAPRFAHQGLQTRQTGGRAVGATSTRSRPASRAMRNASAVEVDPTFSSKALIRKIGEILICSLWRKFVGMAATPKNLARIAGHAPGSERSNR
jgi:AcrR family transcriptional regulator